MESKLKYQLKICFSLNLPSFYESFDDKDVYRPVDGIVKIGVLQLKWARNSKIKPSNTIGVPSKEQINSPVTFGDHKIEAEINKMVC